MTDDAHQLRRAAVQERTYRSDDPCDVATSETELSTQGLELDEVRPPADDRVIGTKLQATRYA